VSNTESDVAPASESSAPEPGAASDAAGPASTSLRETILVTALAFVSALAIGAVLIAIADPDTRAAASYFFAYPIDTFTAAGMLHRMPSEARYVNVSLALHTPGSGVYVKDPSGARATVPLEGSLALPDVRAALSER